MRKKYSIFAAAILSLALVLTACGSSAVGETKNSNAVETKETTKATEATDAAQTSAGNAGDSDTKDTKAASESKSDEGDGESSTAETQASVGIMGSFNTTDVDGNAVDQTIFADYKLTMVNVWATFCGPCLKEMPDLGELAAEYEDKGVRIVGLVSDTLNRDGENDQSQVDYAKEIISDTGADYLHLLPSADLFGLLGQISSVPTTFFVDSEGRQVGSAYMGAREKEDWITIIDSTLEEVQ